MSDNNSRTWWIGFAFIAVVFISGYIAGWFFTRMIYRDEAVEQGAAQYNQQSGKWEWTDHEE